ncbi:flagellar biosynthetic protein FliO [bacterium]|nr:flagellar biosynthetic protein FliO [bacterium]
MRRHNWLRSPFTLAAGAFAGLGLIALLPAGETVAPGAAMLRLLFALVGIIALALGLAPALRRLPTARGGQGQRLRCEEQLALDARHRVALLSVDGRELLISLQADGSRLLLDLGERGETAQPVATEFKRLLAERRGI